MIHKLIPQILMALLVAFGATAQTNAPLSGRITYEGMREIDLSRTRRVVNGQEAGSGADAPEGAPQVLSFTQKLVFAGAMAKEERDQSQNTFRRPAGDGSGNGRGRAGRNLFPFEQTTFLDLANRQRIDVMIIKSDSSSQTYRTERPMPQAEGWQSSNKTKKIAGYTCYKATAVRRAGRRGGAGRNGDNATANQPEAPAETYTVWYTTDLPFTYSPVAGLTPEKGVVLQIESDNESYKATSVSMETVAPETVQPPKDAKAVSPDEMEQLRRKEMANFRQRMMNDGGRQGMPVPRN